MISEGTREDYLTLLSWTWESSEGLGELLRGGCAPRDLIDGFASDPGAGSACPSVSPHLPPATLRALGRARSAWPRRHPQRSTAARLLGEASAFIPMNDPLYPQALAQIPDPPPWLFCRGDPACLQAPAVAVVGSRNASHAGLRAAADISAHLAQSGYTICSGLALGIDAAAHRGALRTGRTVAVLASGLDRLSPHRHRSLAAEITANGCVLTELPPGTPPAKHQFPRRNRIISGLASATIIVEAAQPSGSLHTATAALEQGRDVYTLPWSIYHPQGAGCLRLLRDGALPITALDELGSLFPGVAAIAGMPSATDDEPASFPPEASLKGRARKILALLGDDALPLEDLCRHTGIAAGPMLIELAELEMAGWLVLSDGCYRIRRR